jgi:hypothetical protein
MLRPLRRDESKPYPWYKRLILWWAAIAAVYVTLYILFW